MKRKRFTVAAIVLIVVAALIVVGVWFYYAEHSSQSSNSAVFSVATSTTPIVPVITTSTNAYGVFSQDSEAPYLDEYIDDGIVTTGTYAGYHRVAIATQRQDGPGLPANFMLATKDYKTFILDSNTDTNATSDLPYYFDPSKVIGVAVVPSDLPLTIDEGNFLLSQSRMTIGPLPMGIVALVSNVPGLEFFNDPFQRIDISQLPSSSDAGYFAESNAENNYFSSYADVFVQDQYGLIVDYFLVPQEASTTFFDYTSGRSDIFYSNADFSVPSDTYNSYGVLLPGGCGGDGNTDVLQNISASDLVQVATSTRGVAFYTLKDTNNSLDQSMYYEKVSSLNGSAGYNSLSLFQVVNSSSTMPTYQQYVAKNPILIFKDPWGRWVALGEFDYNLTGGCGKPVIYLYPPKPTEVSIQFSTPMRLTTDIPTYASDGWDVLADPDGHLTNLQPQFTDCAAIDSTLSGSEYAQSACEQNDYPYLYWAGHASGKYPTPTGGWVVSKANIANFLDQKLTEIGLTNKEKSDMVAYWVPELLAKEAPYYRLSFFQTAQMDQFIPMKVSPEPNTVIRVFLDWSPLDDMPAAQPSPEVLTHIDRQGFTLVEWGGLKR